MENAALSHGIDDFQAKAAQMQREIIPKNMRVLTKKMRTKPSIFENERMMILLAQAFLIGANQTEAAAYAGCSRSTIKKHLHQGTLLEYTTDRTPEPQVSTFAELVSLWKSHLTLLCKMVIYADIVNPSTSTKSAWKLLDRFEPRQT